MIERCRDAFPIRLMCRCLHVSTSGYYDWQDRPLSHRAQDNQRLLERIKTIHGGSDGVMGSPRIWKELRYGVDPFSWTVMDLISKRSLWCARACFVEHQIQE